MIPALQSLSICQLRPIHSLLSEDSPSDEFFIEQCESNTSLNTFIKSLSEREMYFVCMLARHFEKNEYYEWGITKKSLEDQLFLLTEVVKDLDQETRIKKTDEMLKSIEQGSGFMKTVLLTLFPNNNSLRLLINNFSEEQLMVFCALIHCFYKNGILEGKLAREQLEGQLFLLMEVVKDLDQEACLQKMQGIVQSMNQKLSLLKAILLNQFSNAIFFLSSLSDENCAQILSKSLEGTPWYQTLFAIRYGQELSDKSYTELQSLGLVLGFCERFVRSGSLTREHLEASLRPKRSCKNLENLSFPQAKVAAATSFSIEVIQKLPDDQCAQLIELLERLPIEEAQVLERIIPCFSAKQHESLYLFLFKTKSVYEALLAVKFPESSKDIEKLSSEVCKKIWLLTKNFTTTIFCNEKEVDLESEQLQLLLNMLKDLDENNQASRISQISYYLNRNFSFLKAVFLVHFPEAEKYRLNLDTIVYLNVIRDSLQDENALFWYQILLSHIQPDLLDFSNLSERDCIAITVGFPCFFVRKEMTDFHLKACLSAGKLPKELMRCSESQAAILVKFPFFSVTEIETFSDEDCRHLLKNLQANHGKYKSLAFTALPTHKERIQASDEEQCKVFFLLKKYIHEGNIEDIISIPSAIWIDIHEYIKDLSDDEFSTLLNSLKDLSEKSNQLILDFSKEAFKIFMEHLLEGHSLDRSFALARFYDPLVGDAISSKMTQYEASIQDVRSSSEEICKKTHQLSNQEFSHLIQDIVNNLSFYQALCRPLLNYSLSPEQASHISSIQIKDYLEGLNDLNPSRFEPIIARLQSEPLFPWQIFFANSAGHSRSTSVDSVTSAFSNISMGSVDEDTQMGGSDDDRKD